MALFRRKKDKTVMRLNEEEMGLAINALVLYRNKALAEDLPTESIDDLIMRLVDKYQ